MPILVNLRRLGRDELVVAGELGVEGLDAEGYDAQIALRQPLRYTLRANKLGHELLVQGQLVLDLECECVRCLKRFPFELRLEDWACALLLEGEDAVAAVNDSVDLTPWVREDILLAFPQHPLCRPECRGLPKALPSKGKQTSGAGPDGQVSPSWAALNKLKLK